MLVIKMMEYTISGILYKYKSNGKVYMLRPLVYML